MPAPIESPVRGRRDFAEKAPPPGVVSVYPRCTSDLRLCRFYRIDRNVESITYALSITGDGSIPTAPTNLLSDQHVKRPLVFQSEHLFQLNASQCAPWSRAATAE